MADILFTDLKDLPPSKKWTDISKGTAIRVSCELPLTKGAPPQFILRNGILYRHAGTGMAAHFYHETTNTFLNLDAK